MSIPEDWTQIGDGYDDKRFPILNDFEIEQFLGKGGEASVYLAMQKTSGATVALKTFDLWIFHGRTEFFVLPGLNHPNIVRFHGSLHSFGGNSGYYETKRGERLMFPAEIQLLGESGDDEQDGVSEVGSANLDIPVASDYSTTGSFSSYGAQLRRFDDDDTCLDIPVSSDCSLTDSSNSLINDGVECLILEYCPGGNLLDFCWNCKFLDNQSREAFLAERTYEVSSALDYLHARGIIHRDIKAGNVLIDGNGKAKLADFGIAISLDGSSELAKNPIRGTLGYMAPEMLSLLKKERLRNHSGGYGTKVDSWGLGIMLYQLLTRNFPFPEPNLGEGASDESEYLSWLQISYKSLKFPSDVDVSDDAKSFVMSLLRVDPKKRLSMAEALEHPWIAKYCPTLNSAEKENQDEAENDEAKKKTGSVNQVGKALAALDLNRN